MKLRTYVAIILVLTCGCIMVVAQVARKKQARPNASSSNTSRPKTSQKKAIVKPQPQVVEADDDPGSTGLKLDSVTSIHASTNGSKRDDLSRFIDMSAITRVVGPRPNSGYMNYQISVRDYNNLNKPVERNYLFSAIGQHDPGYVADARNLPNGNGMFFKFGRYSGMSTGYFLYYFNTHSHVLKNITPNGIVNDEVSNSPDGNLLTYIDGGNDNVPPDFPSTLTIYDIHSLKQSVVASGNSINDTSSWLPDNTLTFSLLKERIYEGNKVKFPVSYIYDPQSGKSHVWMINSSRPVESPNGKYVIFWGANDPKLDYSKRNQHLFIKSLSTGKVSRLRGNLTHDDISRYFWSSDSAHFIVIKNSEDPERTIDVYSTDSDLPSNHIDVKFGDYVLSKVFSCKGNFLIELGNSGDSDDKLMGNMGPDFKVMELNPISNSISNIFSIKDVVGLDLSCS